MAVIPDNQDREERLERKQSSMASVDRKLRGNEAIDVCNGDFRFFDSKDADFGTITSPPSLLSESSSSSDEDTVRLHYYTRAEIKRHNTESSAWIIAGENVYDVTDYVEHHPGGKYSIMKKVGGAVDCAQDMKFHSKSGQRYWDRFLIGKITKVPSKNGHPIEKEWWKFWE